jgi:hypothetical protein
MIPKSAKGINQGKFTERTGRAVALASRTTYLSGRVPVAYSDEFYTPPEIVKALGAFDLDPCAGPVSSHAKRNVRPGDGCGLKRRWRGRVWLNPPYSEIYDWLEKFTKHGNGVCMVNARCDAMWFQRLASAADAVLFLAGRVSFLTGDGTAIGKPKRRPPCGSALVAFGPQNVTALRNSGLRGVLMVRGGADSVSVSVPA